jgi:hypothetical protein
MPGALLQGRPVASVAGQGVSDQALFKTRSGWLPGFVLLLINYVDRDLHRRDRSPVLEPVCGVPVLGPSHSRTIVRSYSIPMVSDCSLQYVDRAWSAFMVVNRAEDASRLNGHHAHPKLATCHTLDLGAKVDRCKQLHRNAFRIWNNLLAAHVAFLFAIPGAERQLDGLEQRKSSRDRISMAAPRHRESRCCIDHMNPQPLADVVSPVSNVRYRATGCVVSLGS